MGKIKNSKQSLSLKKSLILYVSIFVLLALLLSIMTASLCHSAADKIRASYPPSGEKYYLTNEEGKRLGNGTYIGSESPSMSSQDEETVAALELAPVIATPVYSALCIIGAAILFYRNKLKKPLAQLQMAANKISNSDLNFSLKYDSNDELGQLIASFEMMRATLANNFSEMWRQVEERKSLNAAFAHDLRTPLTVLKGYNEMLQTSEAKETREIAATMEKHLSRMETYIASMSTLQRLEDTTPTYERVLLGPFLLSLQESAQILCTQRGKTLHLRESLPTCQLFMDKSFISQVYDNLVANALRYAKTQITLSFTFQDNGLLLTVSDDGAGFDKKSLQKAMEPYFTKETNHAVHFGIGLYICKLLCQQHGGYLKIENTSNGAKVSAFFKGADL